MKMAKAAAWALMMGAATACHAGDVGIGVSLKSNDSAVYLPFKLNPSLMLEGRLEYQHGRQDISASPFGGSASSSTTTSSFGAGLFGLSQLSDATRLYAGGRLSYVSEKLETDYGVGGPNENRQHGWSVAPTLGVEYFPIKQLSLGAEVGLAYSKLTGTASSPGAPDVDLRTTTTSTTSALIVRYYF